MSITIQVPLEGSLTWGTGQQQMSQNNVDAIVAQNNAPQAALSWSAYESYQITWLR
jgi:hypothetical protein